MVERYLANTLIRRENGLYTVFMFCFCIESDIGQLVCQ